MLRYPRGLDAVDALAKEQLKEEKVSFKHLSYCSLENEVFKSCFADEKVGRFYRLENNEN
jgi:hypothetical protein